MTWDDVAEIGPGLPGVGADSAYGTAALHVHRSFMCRLRGGGETQATRSDIEEWSLLDEATPGVLLVAPHDACWPVVPVPAAGRSLVRELVEDASPERTPTTVARVRRAERGNDE
ncbi:MAG: hypothetical protein OEW65_08545 [Thermoleophilia bacterium]|nr:hypothetical protein [Thermoleophilia bacterium]